MVPKLRVGEFALELLYNSFFFTSGERFSLSLSFYFSLAFFNRARRLLCTVHSAVYAVYSMRHSMRLQSKANSAAFFVRTMEKKFFYKTSRL